MKTLILLLLIPLKLFAWDYDFYNYSQPKAQVRFDIYTCKLGISRAELYYVNYGTDTLILNYHGSLITVPASLCKFDIEQGSYYY